MHRFQQVILLVRIRVIDTRDRDSVIDAGLVDRGGQGVLRELEARSCDKSNSSVLVLVTGSLEKLPDLLGPTCSSFPEFFSPVFQLLFGEWSLVCKSLLNPGTDGLAVIYLLDLRILKVGDPQPRWVVLGWPCPLSSLS